MIKKRKCCSFFTGRRKYCYWFAKTEFNRALEQSDKTTEAYYYLSKVYEKIGDLPKARESLAKSKETLNYKRDDHYNEFLNEIYLSGINDLEKQYAE